MFLGLTIFDYFITNTITHSYKIGYTLFRKFISNFINIGLTSIFTLVYNLLKEKLKNLQISDNHEIIWEMIMKMFATCLAFNFNLSYFEYETDIESSDISVVNVRTIKI